MDTNVRPPEGNGPVQRERRVTRPVVKASANVNEAPPTDGASSDLKDWEDAAAEVQKAAVQTWPLRVKLKRAILIKEVNTGEIKNEIAELSFREPTALDIIQVGMPVIITDYEAMSVTFDAAKMAAMMARLAKVPVVFISGMDAVDWVNCATMLQRNFLPDWERMI